jgi:hypothetical protein
MMTSLIDTVIYTSGARDDSQQRMIKNNEGMVTYKNQLWALYYTSTLHTVPLLTNNASMKPDSRKNSDK